MVSEDIVSAAIKQQGILPLFYHDDAETCINIVQALYNGGIRAIEFTNRGVNSLPIFKTLIKERDQLWPGLLAGIGTIKTTDEASSFINAGADFLVSPVFDNGVCDAAYMAKLLWIPGCMTPTEIHTAQQAGCSMIKLFPGNVLGTGFLEAIMPLFKNIDFVVTGGVDATRESIQSWLEAGACGVGLGSKLITRAILESGEYDTLSSKSTELLGIINNLREKDTAKIIGK